MTTWQLQDAKNKFSHVVEKALLEGPQFVTKRGKPSVVILSVEDFEHAVHPLPDLKSYLRTFPQDDLDLSRSKEGCRDLDI